MSHPTTITLDSIVREITVVIDGHEINVARITDADGGVALQLSGVNCNLSGEEPGLYYPQPIA